MSQSLEEIPNPAKGMKVCKLIYWKWLIGRTGLIHYVSGHEVDIGEEEVKYVSVLLAKMGSSTMLMSGGQNCGQVLKDDLVWVFVLIFLNFFIFFCSWVDLISFMWRMRPGHPHSLLLSASRWREVWEWG